MPKIFFINFKNYLQAFEGFPDIYQKLEKVARKYPRVETIFAPPPLLLARVAEVVKTALWAQHLDPKPLGKQTGFLPPEAAKQLGIAGTFLNHSEHPLTDQELKESVMVAKSAGLSIIIFAATPERIYEIKNLIPDYIRATTKNEGQRPHIRAEREGKSESRSAGRGLYIAYEPPELIGAGVERGVSVATAKPDIIPKAVEAAKPVPLIIGAGIFQKEDITTGLKLGAVGAGVASAIVTATNPEKVLNELLSAFAKASADKSAF